MIDLVKLLPLFDSLNDVTIVVVHHGSIFRREDAVAVQNAFVLALQLFDLVNRDAADRALEEFLRWGMVVSLLGRSSPFSEEVILA